MAKPPHWRLIEQALIALCETYGLPMWEERGDRFVTLNGVDYSVEEFAKELEQRL